MAKVSYERRRHKRYEVACPVSLAGDEADAPARSKGINISDGGMLFPLHGKGVPGVGARVHVDFSIPRSTPNTFLMEEFSSKAIVVRAEPAGGRRPARVALRFEQPMDLGIEV
ncbi:MAG: PilZ domain-containing protein [Phycisphaerae bacterium]